MPKALVSDGHNGKFIVFHQFSHLITAKTLILRVTDGVNRKFYSRGCISRHLASWRGHRSMANWLAFCRLAWGANQMFWVLFLTTLMSRMRQRKYGQSNWETINQHTRCNRHHLSTSSAVNYAQNVCCMRLRWKACFVVLCCSAINVAWSFSVL